MAVVSSLGSSNTALSQSLEEAERKLLPENETTLVENNRYILPSKGVHSNDHLVEDVMSHATAYNTDRVPDSFGLIFAYVEGSPVSVTYFNLENSGLLGRSNPTDVSTGLQHNSHASYLKINNFEIRMEQGLEYNFDDENGQSTYDGVAIVYPGVKPQKGDMFYYLLDDGKWGIMVVRGIQRVSISNMTYHKIIFDLQDYLTPERQSYIDSQVTHTAYFDKIKFFTQEYSLLEYESYILLKNLKQLRQEMIDHYIRTYFDQVVSSIMHPDGYFDPYLVSFLQHTISVMDNRIRPKQLYARMYDFNKSVWYAMTKGSRVGLDQTESNWRLRTFVPNFWSGDITSLVDRNFVALGLKSDPNLDYLEQDVPYDIAKTTAYAGMSSAFYEHDAVRMTTFEALVFQTLVTNLENPAGIYEVVSKYTKWDKTQAFYHIPFSLYLIDRAIYSVKQ